MSCSISSHGGRKYSARKKRQTGAILVFVVVVDFGNYSRNHIFLGLVFILKCSDFKGGVVVHPDFFCET